MAYATRDELVAYVSSERTVPADPEATRLLERASELIDDRTFGRAASIDLADLDNAGVTALLSKAACAQAEFWLEFGEDHGIVGLRGSVSIGALSIGGLPMQLAPRARSHLKLAGLLSAMVAVAGQDYAP